MNQDEPALPPFSALDQHDDEQSGGHDQTAIVPALDVPALDEPEVEQPGQPFNWLPIVATIGVLNLVGLILLAYWVNTRSYYDIADAPMIYYAKPEEIIAKAMMQPDPTSAQADLIERLKANHGIVLDYNSVVIASPEFLMYPKDTVLGKSGDKK